MNTPQTPQLHKHSVSRSAFLKLKFPSLPYCEFGLKSGSSTKWNESWHYKNASSGVQVNALWYDDETVSIGVYDPRIKNKFEVNKTVFDKSGNFNQEILEMYCRRFLC